MEQLKGVCSALEECDGFNSEGWIKSRVAGKKRSTIDLYLKQVAAAASVEEEDDIPWDQGAGIFVNHLQQYSKMEQNLKVYPTLNGFVKVSNVIVLLMGLDRLPADICTRLR